MSQGKIIPATGATAIVPNDSAEVRARAIYVGAAGNIKVDMENGDLAVLFKGCVAGSILPISVTKVYSTDTTATDLLALV